MDRLAAITVFAAIADAGSLSAAGRRLSMPLPTVSRQSHRTRGPGLGARLITRTRRATWRSPSRAVTISRAAGAYLGRAGCGGAALWPGDMTSPAGNLLSPRPLCSAACTCCRHHRLFRQFSSRHRAHAAGRSGQVDLIEEGLDVRCASARCPTLRRSSTRVGAVRQVLARARLSCRARRAGRAAGAAGPRLHQLHGTGRRRTAGLRRSASRKSV